MYPLNLINSIRKSDFVCKNLWCKGDEVYGRIYGNNQNKLENLASKNSMQLISLNKTGIVYWLMPYKKRIGIFLGFLISIVLIFFMSNTVIKIRILGCDENLYKKVYSALEINGVLPGKFIPSLDFSTIEMNMLEDVEEISWIAIRSTGGVLTVSVSPATPKPEILTRRLPCNIISTKDAQIVEVQVYAGQLTVLLGDGVKKGDLLVSGFVVDGYGKSAKYHAYAKIIGQYEDIICFEQPYYEEIKVTSNKAYNRKYFNFFSLKCPLFIGEKVKGEYSYTERTNNFSVFTLKIPLGITHCSYSPYEIKGFYYTQEEARQRLNEKMEVYEMNFLSDKEIISREISETINENSISYSVRYLIKGEIGQVSEILMKN